MSTGTSAVAPRATFEAAEAPTATATQAQHGYVPALGSLRAWVTVLVVAHHAVLAYHPYAPPVAKSLLEPSHIWGAFPVVDTARWSGFALFVGVNELYFMSLMFLLSGLFAWNSLKRKGVAGYVRDRAVRLGIPFMVAAGVLAPIAYFPAYLQSGGTGGWSGYWSVFTRPGMWTSGPAWFLWVLLAYDLVLAALYRVMPGAVEAAGAWIARRSRTVTVLAALVAISTAAYLVVEFRTGGMAWWSWGPFYVQSARVLYYFAYFMTGVAIGAVGIERTVFAPGGALARQWKWWLTAAAVAFIVAMIVILRALSVRSLPALPHIGAGAAFALSTACSSFAALALFLHFARERNPIFAALAPCAFGIYLVHYPIATWLQYVMLGVALPGVVKGLVVFASALALSWGLVALLRRIPGVARVI